MKNVNNYKIKYSNFYYKSNGKHIDDGEKSKTESIEIEKWSVDKINETEKTNYDETNTKEILEFYLEENVDDIDYKVEIIKDYVNEFIELDDVIQITVDNGNYYINEYGYNELIKDKILS